MVSYGLAYGMEAFGLAQRLGIETGEAAEILGSYFSAFPLVRELMDRSVAEARARSYTVTLLGRRRPLPDLHSPNRGLRMAAERQAMNAGIQGLAADLFKLALVRLDELWRRAAPRLDWCSRSTTRCCSRCRKGHNGAKRGRRTDPYCDVAGRRRGRSCGSPRGVESWGIYVGRSKDHVSPGAGRCA